MLPHDQSSSRLTRTPEWLREHRKKQAAERLRARNSWMDHDLVFATRHGGPITHTEDWRSWKVILRQAKARDVRVHDARRRRH